MTRNREAFRVWTVAVLLSAGCGPAGPKARPPTAPVTPDRSASDSALARELGVEGARKLEVARSVCAAAVQRREGSLRVGCRACPPFGADSKPGGAVARVGEGDDAFYELEALYPGSFTRAGANEAAAVFAGCEPHAANWGGTLLVEQRGTAWIQKSYRSGFHPHDCKPFRRADGRDTLICLWETDNQSHVHWALDGYDFALGSDEHPEAGWTNLLALDDDSYARCLDDSDAEPVTADAITGFRIVPESAKPRVLVDVRLARGPKTPAYRAQCAELDRADAPAHTVDPSSALNPALRVLTLVWNGASFVLDPTSAKLLSGRDGSRPGPDGR